MDVNSLNELKQIFKDIKPNDIKIVQNFLDMDKLTNINVLKGSKNLEKIILQNGHKYKMGYWDVKSISENQTISNSYGKFKCKWNDENKHLSKAIQQQKFYEFKRQIEYKSKLNGIEFIQVDKFYPSSKTCSCCGNIKKDLKLSDRMYKCDVCGLVIDRDYNASINLANYEVI